MREILFRGKRKDNGEWIEGFYFQKRNPMSEDGLPIYHGISDLPPFGAEVDPETVGQYTGLKDRDNTPIFEGDVMFDLQNECCGTVTYGEWNCSCCDGVFGWALMDGHGDLRDVEYEYRVGGNIHDNPELLKGGAE